MPLEAAGEPNRRSALPFAVHAAGGLTHILGSGMLWSSAVDLGLGSALTVWELTVGNAHEAGQQIDHGIQALGGMATGQFLRGAGSYARAKWGLGFPPRDASGQQG